MRKRTIAIAYAVMLTAGLSLTGIPEGTWETVSEQVWAATTIPGKWIQASDGRWWYKHNDGTYTKNNWECINNRWYFFDESGWMVKGWKKVKEKWYYLMPQANGTFVEGQMVTGWLQDGGRWYYLNPTAGTYKEGEMLLNWQKIQGKWYYFSPATNSTWKQGQRVSGWLNLNGKTYYLDKDGVMQTGVMILDKKKYTFADSGELLSEEDVEEAENGDKIAQKALESMDTPFQWGGKELGKGCDNAGFLYGVLTACGYQVPEKLAEQMKTGTEIDRKDIKPGDLVFYRNGTVTEAICLSENQVIYAASPRWGVRITTLNHPGKILTVRRIG